MAISLKNLSARAPMMHDLQAVTDLVRVCERSEHGVSDCTQEDILAIWHQAGFHLRNDAWVIATKGQLVGYGCVWQEEETCLAMKIVVHPDYQERGIGTLLLRLAEQRARMLAIQARPGLSVTLGCTVSQSNEKACQLLEHEGYSLVRHFWHITIEVDEAAASVSRQSGEHGKLKVALDINVQSLNDAAHLYERDGVYAIRQYVLFEKLLRNSQAPSVTEKIDDRLVLI